MKIGVIVAMEKELRQIRNQFSEQQVVVQQCGIGKVNAAIGTMEMIREHHPDMIISTGCAGGHGEGIRVQDVVVSTELCYHDVYCGTAIGHSVYGQVQGMPARFPADPYLLETARKLEFRGREDSGVRGCEKCTGAESQSSPIIHEGLIVTGDWFVDSKDKMREIIGHFPEAKAVDMESAAIAHTCYRMSVPFISFRIISDLPLQDTDASMYHDFWERIADNSFQVTSHYLERLLTPQS